MAEISIAGRVEAQMEALGYELVELQQAGNQPRPILRLRIDREDSAPGSGVTVEECARVSRALEQHLEEQADISATYTLEVSSPGVERPLVRRRDWDRFVGQDVAVTSSAELANGTKRVQGELLGVAKTGDEERVRLRLENGDEIAVPLAGITRAHLVFRWK
jgi:ribosome maturation factor RimP